MMQSSFEFQQVDMLTECQTFATEDEEMCWDFDFSWLGTFTQDVDSVLYFLFKHI